MPVLVSPSEPPFGGSSKTNHTFRCPINDPSLPTNDQGAPSSIWQTPYVDTEASTASLRPKAAKTSMAFTTCATESIDAEVNFEFPEGLPVEESNEPNLRDLYLKGQTYTLAMSVEQVLLGISLFGGKVNKYRLCMKRIYALGNTSAPAEPKQMSEWDDSDSGGQEKASNFTGGSRREKAKQNKELAKDAEKWYSEMEEEGERLLVSLHSLLAPLEKSVETLRNSIEHVPSLSDPIFWASNYDEKLKRALEWDAVVQMTALDHLLPQYLPVYNSLVQVLTREFPTATTILEIIPGEGAGLAMAHLVRTIFRTALQIKFQAKELCSLTHHLSSTLQNCVMSLQWHTKQLLGVVDCNPLYKGLRQEAEAGGGPEGGPGCSPHTALDKRIIVIGTLSDIILTLRQLRLSDDKHIITLPTSYLDIPINTDKTECSASYQEERQILAYLTSFKSSVEFLNKYLKINLDIIDPKFLLPFCLEMGMYTRGTILTQADKLLSGWVVWREICLTVGEWESMESPLNTRDQNVINKTIVGMRPGDDISKASSVMSACTTNSSIAKGKGPASASEHSSGSFKDKFSFTLISIPPAEELAPKSSLPKDSLPHWNPIAQLTHKVSQRLRGNINSHSPPKGRELSLPTPINELNYLAGPPQKIWPAAALAVQSKGIVSHIGGRTLYIPMAGEPPKVLLDENFTLEDVLRFYAAAMEEEKITPFSIPGSSVARAYWQITQLDEDRKRNADLIDALLAEPALPSPLKKKRGTDKLTMPQRASSMERKKIMIGHMMKRLSRFTFGKFDSTDSFYATHTKDSNNPNASSEGANCIPIYTPPPPGHLDSEQISSITTCFNLRREFRDTLRLLSEMKTEVKCLFDSEKFIKQYHDAYNMDMPMRRELLAPIGLLDREWAWRKIPKNKSGGPINDTAGGVAGAWNERRRIELD